MPDDQRFSGERGVIEDLYRRKERVHVGMNEGQPRILVETLQRELLPMRVPFDGVLPLLAVKKQPGISGSVGVSRLLWLE